MVTQFGPIWPILGERAALQSTMRRCFKRLQEISLFPNLYPLIPSPLSYESYLRIHKGSFGSFQWCNLTTQGDYNVYPNPRDPPYKDTQPSSSPLCEPWASTFSSTSKICKIHLNTSHNSPKSCHDSDQSRHDCLWTTVVNSPFQVNLVRKLFNHVTISHIVSRFSISKRPTSLPIQSRHGACNRDAISGLPEFSIWSQYTTMRLH